MARPPSISRMMGVGCARRLLVLPLLLVHRSCHSFIAACFRRLLYAKHLFVGTTVGFCAPRRCRDSRRERRTPRNFLLSFEPHLARSCRTCIKRQIYHL